MPANNAPMAPQAQQAPMIAQQAPGAFSPAMLAAAMKGMQGGAASGARGEVAPQTGLEGIGRLAQAVQQAHQKANPNQYNAQTGAYTGGAPSTGWDASVSAEPPAGGGFGL